MGKFERIVAQIALLPVARQDEIADFLETALAGDLTPASPLSDDQIAEIEQLIAGPAPLASVAEVEAFFEEALKISA